MAQFTPLTGDFTDWSTEFESFQNASNDSQHQQPSVEDDLEEDICGQVPYGDDDEDFSIRPLSK